MVFRLKTTKPRDILSIEQQQQQNIVNKKLPIIQNENANGNEETVFDLVQDDHEVVLERIRLVFLAYFLLYW